MSLNAFKPAIDQLSPGSVLVLLRLPKGQNSSWSKFQEEPWVPAHDGGVKVAPSNTVDPDTTNVY